MHCLCSQSKSLEYILESERHYQETINIPVLGLWIWRMWKYPKKSENTFHWELWFSSCSLAHLKDLNLACLNERIEMKWDTVSLTPVTDSNHTCAAPPAQETPSKHCFTTEFQLVEISDTSGYLLKETDNWFKPVKKDLGDLWGNGKSHPLDVRR